MLRFSSKKNRFAKILVLSLDPIAIVAIAKLYQKNNGATESHLTLHALT